MVLDTGQLEELAMLVAERLQKIPNGRLRTVAEVADYLGVKVSFVREHAAEMGAKRLGQGSKAPLRFDLADVEKWLRTCSSIRGSEAGVSAAKPKVRSRRARGGTGTSGVLLPIRGQNPPSEDAEWAAA